MELEVHVCNKNFIGNVLKSPKNIQNSQYKTHFHSTKVHVVQTYKCVDVN